MRTKKGENGVQDDTYMSTDIRMRMMMKVITRGGGGVRGGGTGKRGRRRRSPPPPSPYPSCPTTTPTTLGGKSAHTWRDEGTKLRGKWGRGTRGTIKEYFHSI